MPRGCCCHIHFLPNDNWAADLSPFPRISAGTIPIITLCAENGITLPYTYIGIGHLENARKGVTKNGSILYDIHMDNPLPQELQEDFQWME